MKETIKKYISENQIINIRLVMRQNNSGIWNNAIYFYYLTLENDDIFKEIVLCGKFISIEVYDKLPSFKNIYILSYANEIFINTNDITNKNVIDVIHRSVKLQKLTIESLQILEKVNVINKLCEKEFLRYIEFMFVFEVNLDNIYQITTIKSLDTLYLNKYLYNNNLYQALILKILCYVNNNLNKNIKIVIDCYGQDIKFKKILNLIAYNFKVNKFDYIFSYISSAFRKFDNLYDLNLYYHSFYY